MAGVGLSAAVTADMEGRSKETDPFTSLKTNKC